MFKVENKFKGANVSRTVHFTDELFSKLNEISDQNEISFNLLVLQCCQYDIDNLEENNEHIK